MPGQVQKLTDQDATYHFVKLSNNKNHLIGKVEVFELLVIAPIGELSCLIRASDPFRRISSIWIEAPRREYYRNMQGTRLESFGR